MEQEFQALPTSVALPHGTSAIDRGAQLLLRVLEAERPLGLTELAEAAGLPKSTASRLVTVLERRGLVQQDGPRGLFRPGPAILRVATRDLFERNVVEVSRPSLERLGEASGETINLALPGVGGVEHVAQVDSRHFLGAGQWIGREVDYHCTAVGKVLMAFGAAEVPPAGASLPRLAPRTITDVHALRADLETVRRTGCATAVDELEPGLAAMAAPVSGAGGDVFAAISITGPTLRLGPSRIGELRPILITEARALSRRLGHDDAGDHAA